MQRVKTFDSTGVSPGGVLFAGDLNAIQDAAAGLTDLTQQISVSSLVVGDSTLQFLKFATGVIRLSAALRADGIITGLGGLLGGSFTTTQRNAISSPPYGLVILNTTTNEYEWNAGTPSVPAWQAIGSQFYSGMDLLANQPAANTVASGSTFFATDQVVDYISNGTAWTRKGIPAGSVVSWHSAKPIPTGWVAFDGTSLPQSTGIYAALYAYLGNSLVTPDTRGRATYGVGTNADVNTVGNSDGLIVANRSPKHNHTVTDPGHSHTINGGNSDFLTVNGPSETIQGEVGGATFNDQAATDVITTGVTVGVGGTTHPVDTGGYIVAYKIAKL